jgi:integrase/recombinase XerD
MTTALTAPSLGRHVQAFFADYLTAQRDLSPNTVLSYRDALLLLLRFASDVRNKPVAQLGFDDVGPDTVLAFLKHLEVVRKNAARTRNARLAALHTFFGYVAEREPRVLDICQRIASIPVKRTTHKTEAYLERDEILHILGSIDRSTQLGQRDYLLVRFLFETGARAQEVAGVKCSSLRLFRPQQVRILGKGRKERLCPIRADTARIIRQYLRGRGITEEADAPLFSSVRGKALTRIGVLRAVQRHARKAALTMPRLAKMQIGAHTFRHSAAVHLLRAGNDLTVVRSWLGHVSIATTDLYTEIDMETKRRALEATKPIKSRARSASWKSPSLLAWLEAL